MNYSNIRMHNGSQNIGFEELCCQIIPFYLQSKIIKIERINGAGGDGGVEIKYYSEDGQTVGMQAKFFSTLGRSQWSQIDGSVRTMLTNHSDITQFYLCCPLNRTPAQISKWESYCAQWNSDNTRSKVEYIWLGESELNELLIRPETQYLKSYWLDCPYFSTQWLHQKTDSNIQQLHHRYTPELHQKTLTEKKFNLITAVGLVVEEYKALSSDLWGNYLRVIEHLKSEYTKDVKVDITELDKQIQVILDQLFVELHKGKISKQSENLISNLNQLDSLIEAIIDECSTIENGPHRVIASDIARKLSSDSRLYEAQDDATNIERQLTEYLKAQSSQFWLLEGEAGTGKSHVLASITQTLIGLGHSCLFLVGERFTANYTLEQQLIEQLSWQGSFEQFLSCLSTQAQTCNKTSYIIIDAINESPERRLWYTHLNSFAEKISLYSGLKLILSCRSDLLKSNLNPSLNDKYFSIHHSGFDLDFNDAVIAYFKGYNVCCHQQPTLNNEFRNPLFLKTLCEAYQGRTLPSGTLTFLEVIRAWERRIAENIEQLTDCPTDSTSKAISEIIGQMSISPNLWLSESETQVICKRHFSDDTKSKGLYYKLLSEGFIAESVIDDSITHTSETHVRLQYERFSDIRMVLST